MPPPYRYLLCFCATPRYKAFARTSSILDRTPCLQQALVPSPTCRHLRAERNPCYPVCQLLLHSADDSEHNTTPTRPHQLMPISLRLSVTPTIRFPAPAPITQHKRDSTTFCYTLIPCCSHVMPLPPKTTPIFPFPFPFAPPPFFPAHPPHVFYRTERRGSPEYSDSTQLPSTPPPVLSVGFDANCRLGNNYLTPLSTSAAQCMSNVDSSSRQSRFAPP